jgi:IS30 family transposase
MPSLFSERPAEFEDRTIPGDWEGDLLRGIKSSHIGAQVELHSRFAILVEVRSKDTGSVAAALTRQVREF